MEAANQSGVVVPFIWAFVAFGIGVVAVIAMLVRAAMGGPNRSSDDSADESSK